MTKKYKLGVDPHDDDFGAVLNCAVRYCLGRRTYMPSLVTGYIRPLLPLVTIKTLWCFERDIVDAEKYGYGDKCDEVTWMDFLNAVQSELLNRGEKLYVSPWQEREENKNGKADGDAGA